MTIFGLVILALLTIWLIWVGIGEYRKGQLKRWLLNEWKDNLFIVAVAVGILMLVTGYFSR